MSGTTPGGLRFPSGTDMVRDGDNDMQYLAEQLDQDPVEYVARRSGAMNVAHTGWIGATGWAGASYSHGTGLSVGGGQTGILCDLAGRYYCEGVWMHPANNTGRRGVGIGLSTDTPEPQIQQLYGAIPANHLGVTSAQLLRINGTISVPAGGLVRLYMLQETGATVAADATRFSLLVRRLRLGQTHA